MTASKEIMTAEQNIETARQMYDAFGRGDVRAVLDRVTDDVGPPRQRPRRGSSWSE
jgi:ketosteroid isomerase-like protein